MTPHDGDVPSFAVHEVPRRLRPVLTSAVGYRVPARAVEHHGLPTLGVTLVVELAAPLRVRGLGPETAAHASVGGLHDVPAFIDGSFPQEGIQCALRPSGAALVLGCPVGEIANLNLPLASLTGQRAADRLVEGLRAAPTWPARFRVLDAWVLARLASAGERHAPAAEVAHAWRLIVASGGRHPVADVARSVGWSRRHLAARTRMLTGLTPKGLGRIARFQAARRLLVADPAADLATVAAAVGFADQQHLSRDWRALAGMSPRQWVRAEFPFVHDATTDGAAVF